jgi:hypothetical protein
VNSLLGQLPLTSDHSIGAVFVKVLYVLWALYVLHVHVRDHGYGGGDDDLTSVHLLPQPSSSLQYLQGRRLSPIALHLLRVLALNLPPQLVNMHVATT